MNSLISDPCTGVQVPRPLHQPPLLLSPPPPHLKVSHCNTCQCLLCPNVKSQEIKFKDVSLCTGSPKPFQLPSLRSPLRSFRFRFQSKLNYFYHFYFLAPSDDNLRAALLPAPPSASLPPPPSPLAPRRPSPPPPPPPLIIPQFGYSTGPVGFPKPKAPGSQKPEKGRISHLRPIFTVVYFHY